MLDLLQLWKNTALTQSQSAPLGTYPDDTDSRAIAFDKNTLQSSFEFKEAPQILFVTNTKTLEPANTYETLPEVTLTPAEEAIRLDIIAQQKARNPSFYDGKQMLISGVLYDEDSNTLYLEAKRVPYSFIVALNSKKFPEDSRLYDLKLFKTGVLAPLITRDDMMLLLERSALGLRSVPAGFLEAEDGILNFDDTRNLVTETANNEILEEIAGIKGKKTQRFEYSTPQVTAISFRQTGTLPIGTIEFVAPAYTHCHSSYLQEHVVPDNLAKDAKEHTTRSDLIPLEARKREQLLSLLITGPEALPGRSLYLPLAISTARLANQNTCTDALPRHIPTDVSRVWPLSIFKSEPSRPLIKAGAEEEVKEEKTCQLS